MYRLWLCRWYRKLNKRFFLSYTLFLSLDLNLRLFAFRMIVSSLLTNSRRFKDRGYFLSNYILGREFFAPFLRYFCHLLLTSRWLSKARTKLDPTIETFPEFPFGIELGHTNDESTNFFYFSFSINVPVTTSRRYRKKSFCLFFFNFLQFSSIFFYFLWTVLSCALKLLLLYRFHLYLCFLNFIPFLVWPRAVTPKLSIILCH